MKTTYSGLKQINNTPYICITDRNLLRSEPLTAQQISAQLIYLILINAIFFHNSIIMMLKTSRYTENKRYAMSARHIFWHTHAYKFRNA